VAEPERRAAAPPLRAARSPGAPAAFPPRRQRARAALVALAALLAASAVALAMALARNAGLETRLGELSGELAATRAALDAHEARLEQVRGAVARLHALVQQDPLEAPPPTSPPPAP
jgi:hypothetical protein